MPCLTVADTGVGIPPKRSAAGVRALLPRAERALAHARRLGHRPRTRAGARQAARRHDRRRQRRRRRARRSPCRCRRARRICRATHRRGPRREPRRRSVPTRTSTKRSRWLPTVGDATATFPDRSCRAAGDAAAPSATVLLVDDNADMREYVRRLLSRAVHVVTAADGAEALAAIEREPPDLVLTDVMMPQLDGFAPAEGAARRTTRTREIPVVLLSARAGEESRIEGIDAGADDYWSSHSRRASCTLACRAIWRWRARVATSRARRAKTKRAGASCSRCRTHFAQCRPPRPSRNAPSTTSAASLVPRLPATARSTRTRRRCT